MSALPQLKVKIFADGADLNEIKRLAEDVSIAGFTTNPTLMRKAGVADYADFARQALAVVAPRSISFEVFADDIQEMERQARIIAAWGENVYVKIPVTNTKGVSTSALVSQLGKDGIKVNVTAILTMEQVREVTAAVSANTPSYVSVFAGRIADTGRDPVPVIAECVKLLAAKPKAEVIWASPREVLNLAHAESVGCHVITVTQDILSKRHLWGKPLDVYSLETVKMFYDDALKAGFGIK